MIGIVKIVTEMIDIIIETIGITDRRIEGHLMIGNGNIITQVDVGLLHPTQEVPQEGIKEVHRQDTGTDHRIRLKEGLLHHLEDQEHPQVLLEGQKQ